MKPEEYIGKKFGRLTIVKYMGKNKWNAKYYLCKCDCDNNEIIVRLNNLMSGHTNSCGCLHKEIVTNHGLSDHYLYMTWFHMMDRCYNLKCERYKDYGGRGISVYAEWHNIVNFVRDIEPIYVKGLMLDRIDNNKNYEPGNVRYVNDEISSRNKRNNVYLTFEGKTQIIEDWAKEKGLLRETLCKRLFKHKWTLEKALTTPIKK